MFHVVFAFPCVFGSVLEFQSNFYNLNLTFSKLFDLTVKNFNWFMYEI